MTHNITRLSILEVIQTAWSKVKGSKGTFFIITLFYLLIKGTQTWLNTIGSFLPLILFLKLVLFITQLILIWGMIYLGAKRANDVFIHYTMIKHIIHLDLFLKMVGYYLLYALILALPVTLFFLPVLFFLISSAITTSFLFNISAALFDIVATGLIIFLLIRLYLAPIIIIMQGLRPWAAIKLSFNATQSNGWRLLGLLIINSLILGISAIPLGVGLIWSIPYLSINYGIVYRKLIPQV